MTTQEYYDIKPDHNGWRELRENCFLKLERGVTIGNNVSFNGTTVVLRKGVTIGDNVVFGSGCHIGHNTIIENNVEFGHNVSIGDNTTIYENVKIGSYAKIGDSNNIFNTAIIGEGVVLGNRVTIGEEAILSIGVKLGDDVFIDNKQTSAGLHKYFISTYPEKSIFWKWVTTELKSPGWGCSNPIKYKIGEIIIEPKAKRSEIQCDVGLHVFRPGIKPEFAGLNKTKQQLVCLEVEVDRKDICFAGLPGNDMKLRVKKLKVLRKI